jgi:hypothetical protein
VPCVAVIPARRAEATIARTLEALRLGNSPFVSRVLVVTSAEDPTADVVRSWSRVDGAVSLVALASPATAGAARNAGRAAAPEARLLLFVDADCALEAGGAEALRREMDARGAAAVSARVACEGGAVARCRHVLEFKEAASRREPPAGWLPPSTTMLCRAAAFDRSGGFPDLWPGEDLVFSQALRDGGGLVVLSREAATLHRHPAGLAGMLRHQVRLGRTAAIARRTRAMKGSALAASPWRATLLLPGRALRIGAWQAGEGARALAWTLVASPLLLTGLVAWTAGFVSGTGAPLVADGNRCVAPSGSPDFARDERRLAASRAGAAL